MSKERISEELGSKNDTSPLEGRCHFFISKTNCEKQDRGLIRLRSLDDHDHWDG